MDILTLCIIYGAISAASFFGHLIWATDPHGSRLDDKTKMAIVTTNTFLWPITFIMFLIWCWVMGFTFLGKLMLDNKNRKS